MQDSAEICILMVLAIIKNYFICCYIVFHVSHPFIFLVTLLGKEAKLSIKLLCAGITAWTAMPAL